MRQGILLAQAGELQQASGAAAPQNLPQVCCVLNSPIQCLAHAEVLQPIRFIQLFTPVFCTAPRPTEAL